MLTLSDPYIYPWADSWVWNEWNEKPQNALVLNDFQDKTERYRTHENAPVTVQISPSPPEKRPRNPTISGAFFVFSHFGNAWKGNWPRNQTPESGIGEGKISDNILLCDEFCIATFQLETICIFTSAFFTLQCVTGAAPFFCKMREDDWKMRVFVV